MCKLLQHLQSFVRNASFYMYTPTGEIKLKVKFSKHSTTLTSSNCDLCKHTWDTSFTVQRLSCVDDWNDYDKVVSIVRYLTNFYAC